MNDGDSRDQNEVAVFSLVGAAFEELRLEPDPKQIDRLAGLAILLSEWAPRINLTGHRDAREITSRLILDAVALATALPELRDLQTVADLGSGAGFPGLPIAIMNPHLEVRLVDARRKRNHFQREARRRLGLDRVDPLLGRSEDLPPKPSDLVIAQAMAQPELALEHMMTWAQPGGWIVLPASEGTEAPRTPPGIQAFEERTYRVPGTGLGRTLWVARLEG